MGRRPVIAQTLHFEHPFRLSFELEGLPRTNSAGARNHWVKRRERLVWERHVAFATVGHRPKVPIARARVEITRHSSQEPDSDNLQATAKHLLDALVKLGVLLDDSPAVIGREPVCSWQKAPPKLGKVRVVVQELET